MSDIDYDARVFRSTETGGNGPTGYYHQRDELVWAEFAGGSVLMGRLVGRRREDGVLELAYSQVLADDRVVCGECVSTPEVLADGRIRLREQWRRTDGSTGVSWIEEAPAAAGGQPPR